MVQGGVTATVPNRRRRRRRLWIAVVLTSAIVVAVGLGLVIRYHALAVELDQARGALRAKRYGLARQRLIRLADRWTNNGEVLLLLGNCEHALGRRDAAVAAWSTVSSHSPFFGQAVSARAVQLIERGRYRPAEDLLLSASSNRAVTNDLQLESALIRLYQSEGRFDDAQRVMRGAWSRAANPVGLVKELWSIDHGPRPVELLRSSLDQADKDDDRVWLGRAYHAILTGRFADAPSWLARCLNRRPQDHAVWLAALKLAFESGDATVS